MSEGVPDPPIGQSSLFVPVPQAVAQVPDITEFPFVPGGRLIPLSPFPAGSVPTVNRNEYRLSFPVGQGMRLLVRRIHVALPVYCGEKELEKSTITTKTLETFNSEAEAKKKWVEAIGGIPKSEETIVPLGYATSYEKKVKTLTGAKLVGAFKNEVEIEYQQVTERSILPVTVTAVVRLKGPEGELWSESFEVPLHWNGEFAPGSAIGVGTIDSYADLQNGLAIDPSKTYSLALQVFIPVTVLTNTQLGIERVAGATVTGNGGLTLFYDVEPVAVGK